MTRIRDGDDLACYLDEVEVEDKQNPVAQGAYGVVFKGLWPLAEKGNGDGAQPKGDQIVVAIKKLQKIFRNVEASKRVSRELYLLNAFQRLDQVVEMFFVRLIRDDLYIVMEYADRTLYKLLFDHTIDISEAHVQSIAMQLLLGLRFFHKHGVYHRDVSTNNILIEMAEDPARWRILFCDFGMARVMRYDGTGTQGVVTQYYRAPEVLMDAKYDLQCDVWSVGVILAELLCRRHLFYAATNDVAAQLKSILSVLGPVDDAALPPAVRADGKEEAEKKCASSFASAPFNAVQFVRNVSDAQRQHGLKSTLHERIAGESSGSVSDDAIGFIESLLKFDPRDRLTADAALKHRWLQREEPIKRFIEAECVRQDSDSIQSAVAADMKAVHVAMEMESRADAAAIEQALRSYIEEYLAGGGQHEMPTNSSLEMEGEEAEGNASEK